jgi:hypothetical protein
LKVLLLVLLLLLASIWFYVGYLRVETEAYLRPRLRGGFWIFLALVFLVAYTQFYQERNAIAQLAEHIQPYSEDMTPRYVPRLPGENVVIWMFETVDSPESVASFYAAPENRKGWQLSGQLPMLVLRKENQKIVVGVTRKQQITNLSYQLSVAE